MKTTLTLTLLLLQSFVFSQSDKAECTEHHTGNYIVRSADFGDTYIKRTKKFQIEKGVDARTGNKYKVKDRIVWINSCTYKLVALKIKDKSGVVGNETLTFKIIDSRKDYYIVRLTDGLNGFTAEVKVIRDK